jgi:hypothetical protein
LISLAFNFLGRPPLRPRARAAFNPAADLVQKFDPIVPKASGKP